LLAVVLAASRNHICQMGFKIQMLLHACPRTTIYVCPHTTICVSAYNFMRVYICQMGSSCGQGRQKESLLQASVLKAAARNCGKACRYHSLQDVSA
jgi:hypothetical protein